jgi:2-iminobutanoate/2-iminopropanoate deaminase
MTCRTRLLLALSICTLQLAAADKIAVRPAGSATVGPYSPGIQAGSMMYVSGQIGRDAKTGQIPEDFNAEVKLALDNAGAILKEAGYSFDDAVTVQVYLTDLSLFDRMNAVYKTYFPEPYPARTTVGVAKLLFNARIEVTVTAWKKKN